ncbi:hypothetical protein Cgig2_031274 [Carnegiea gigantea]|uniref:Protein HGH1 homolog n=1 Tax=Carnegiea gigantea TaxID=171969 RepID=A0A9Q1KMH2_9CARY|nr:hypothetical protein Cgig2_031274 [Carnegiea gigantea]
MATELEELLDFLSSPSPPVKRAAVDIVRGLTGSEDGMQSLAKYSNVLLPKLSHLLDDPKEVAEPAAESLVNLSQNTDIAGLMISMGMVKTAMDHLYKPESAITRLLVMLLVNLTQLDAGISSLLQVEDEKMHGLYVMKLVRSFCRSPNEKQGDPFEHVGSILVNISKMEAGRKFLLDPKRGLLKQIIMQFDSKSSLRKKGVSGTIRNCCFEAENQLPNILLISEFLWPSLLLPVAGNKIYRQEDTSKMPRELGTALSIEREPVTDTEIRVQALEAIYLITLQEAGRRAFWSINGPRILQVGYEDEEDPKVMEAYERVGALVTGNSGEAAKEHAVTSPPVIALQFVIAMVVLDTWQYFMHRYMHHNKFLYRHIHSQHHRLVVPYAFGALYNHPLEGIILDTVGGALSFLVTGMSARTSIFFFSFATIKTVDDHCGLMLPGNLFHIFFRNNSAYHDVHHQLYGSKYNFSQPFFVTWDRILGTYMPYSLEQREGGGFEARPTKEWKDD